MKYIFVSLISIIATYLVLDYLNKKNKTIKQSDLISKELLINLSKTPEAKELILSDQFLNVIKTNEFKQLIDFYGNAYMTKLLGF